MSQIDSDFIQINNKNEVVIYPNKDLRRQSMFVKIDKPMIFDICD